MSVLIPSQSNTNQNVPLLAGVPRCVPFCLRLSSNSGMTARNENNHARRASRTFVLLMFAVVGLAFLLVIEMFHRPVVGKQHSASTRPPAQKNQ